MICCQRSMFDGKKPGIEISSGKSCWYPSLLILNQGPLMSFVGLWSRGLYSWISRVGAIFFTEKRLKESYDPSVNPPRHLPDFGQILETENLRPLLFAMQFWHGAVYRRLPTHGFAVNMQCCSWHIEQKHEESDGYTSLPGRSRACFVRIKSNQVHKKPSWVSGVHGGTVCTIAWNSGASYL